MHIPDGYLGPKTCAALYAVMLPVWYIALKKVKTGLKPVELPLLAFLSSFLFIIMMFNFPVPGGSTGHIIGGALISIFMGPWVGVVSMTLVLFLQAILFGDGGILSFGANAFNMAFVMSFVASIVFNTIAGKNNKRFFLASFLASYIAVNIAAFFTAVELGIQPVVEVDKLRNPLYAPYPLEVAIPAMLVSHLLFFGPIEGLGTAMILSHLRKKNEEVFSTTRASKMKPLWALLFILVLLSPLGIIWSGVPWGEWGREEILPLIGYLPDGMSRFMEFWSGVMPDYGIMGINPYIGYAVSSALGSTLIVSIIYAIGRLWHR